MRSSACSTGGRQRSAFRLGALRRSAILTLVLVTVACSAPERSESAPGALRGEPIQFLFYGATGERVSGESTRGRATAIAFITTYDIPSQLLLRRLKEAVLSVRPKANAVAVLLEPPKYAALIGAYRDSLGLPFPVVMADPETLARRGPFGYVDRVPTTVVLDHRGREIWRYSGAAELDDLEAALLRGARPGVAARIMEPE